MINAILWWWTVVVWCCASLITYATLRGTQAVHKAEQEGAAVQGEGEGAGEDAKHDKKVDDKQVQDALAVLRGEKD